MNRKIASLILNDLRFRGSWPVSMARGPRGLPMNPPSPSAASVASRRSGNGPHLRTRKGDLVLEPTAPEDGLTPRPDGLPRPLRGRSREASWSAAALCRFSRKTGHARKQISDVTKAPLFGSRGCVRAPGKGFPTAGSWLH